MRRLYRFVSPSVVFALVGLVFLVVGPLPEYHLRGGLASTAVYGLLIQIVTALLPLTLIDDLSAESSRILPRVFRQRGRSMIDVVSRPVGFWKTLADFYTWPVPPLLLLSFGAGVTVSAFVVALLDERPPLLVVGQVTVQVSEVVLAAVLGVVATVLLIFRGASYYGWVTGFCTAVALCQIQFMYGSRVAATLVGWAAVAVTLCGLRLVVSSIWAGVVRRRESLAPDGPG